MKYLLSALLVGLLPVMPHQNGYDGSYVDIKTLTVGKEPYGIVRLKRSGNHVKVKYFASKDLNNTSVYDRYQAWANNRSIIAYSSGTYMSDCNAAIAAPVGICIDQGVTVNDQLVEKDLDGLVIVYATGGIVASNLKEGNLGITEAGGVRETLDIRRNAFDLAKFKKWARDQEATVFQTHLFAYKDQLLVNTNGSPKLGQRRFLAVCKLDNGDVVHYLINLPTPATVYDGAKKAFDYLKNFEDVKEVTFMINLDTGCQDIFTLYDAKGNEVTARHFQGDHAQTPLRNAANILAYYFE